MSDFNTGNTGDFNTGNSWEKWGFKHCKQNTGNVPVSHFEVVRDASIRQTRKGSSCHVTKNPQASAIPNQYNPNGALTPPCFPPKWRNPKTYRHHGYHSPVRRYYQRAIRALTQRSLSPKFRKPTCTRVIRGRCGGMTHAQQYQMPKSQKPACTIVNRGRRGGIFHAQQYQMQKQYNPIRPLTARSFLPKSRNPKKPTCTIVNRGRVGGITHASAWGPGKIPVQPAIPSH